MPIQTWDTGGGVLFDSDAVANGICLGAFALPAGSALSQSFSLLAGATVRVMGLTGDTDLSGVSVSYPSSIPTVTASASIFNRYFVLWATGTPTITSGAGMQAVSSAGTIALSPAGRGCNYVGRASYAGTTASTGTPNTGGDLGAVSMTISGCPNPPVAVLGVTSSAYARISRGPISLGGGSWLIEVQAVATLPVSGGAAWPALLTPDVYVFSPPASPGAGAQAAVYDTDGTLAYDLLGGRLLVTAGPLSFPAGSGADTYSAGLPAGVSGSLCGAFGVPFYNEVRSAFRGGTTYHQRTLAAMWTLSGGSLVRQRTIVSTVLDIDNVNVINEQSAVAEVISLAGL